MEDTLSCPVCGNILRNVHLADRFLHVVSKKSDFIERTCTQGHNHSLRFFVDEKTKKVDCLKVSLNPRYSRFVEINYVMESCLISCWKNNQNYYIEIDRLLEPDFPDLTKLREKVGVFIIFS